MLFRSALHDRWQAAAKTAKDIKAKWESAVEELQRQLRSVTHQAPMPLFDAHQAEADLARMESAAGAMGIEPLTLAENASATLLAGPWGASEESGGADVAPPTSESLTEALSGSPAELF